MHRVFVALGLSLFLSLGLFLACSETEKFHCIGKPACEGEWKVFAGHVGVGEACTTPAGDLHVRYESMSSDELVEIWSKLIPEKMGLKLKDKWGAAREYRQAWYVREEGGKLLNVSVVQTASTKVRTIRLTWEYTP